MYDYVFGVMARSSAAPLTLDLFVFAQATVHSIARRLTFFFSWPFKGRIGVNVFDRFWLKEVTTARRQNV